MMQYFLAIMCIPILAVSALVFVLALDLYKDVRLRK